MTINSIGNNYISIEPTGEITYPLQSAFYAYLAADKNNVSGNSTVYTVPFDTESFDRNGDFNTTTGFFTVPVTGVYYLSASGLFVGNTNKASSQVYIYNETTTTILLGYKQTWASTATRDIQANVSGLQLLTASHVLSVQVVASGSASDDADLRSLAHYTYFCGKLVS